MNEEMMKHLREAWRLAGEIAETECSDQQSVFDEALEEIRQVDPDAAEEDTDE